MIEDEVLILEYVIKGWDFNRAGEASCKIKETLKNIGIPQDILKRIAIASYEAEMNVVMYAKSGILHCEISPNKILLTLKDEGPGIENIELAMKPGFSTATPEIREMGFGAGMGLPNIKQNSDSFKISTEIGTGTRLEMRFDL
jgi:anti-sigma regulatory factor (Ser/Thr protein kinase)